MKHGLTALATTLIVLMLSNASRCDYISGSAPFINTWLVIGTFSNGSDSAGFSADLISERNVRPQEGISAGGSTWRYFDDRVFSRNYDDYQDLFSYFRIRAGVPTDAKIAYAQVYVHSAMNQKGQIRLGADTDVKAWLNGDILLSNTSAGNCGKDDVSRGITLKKGWNRLLLKIANRGDGLFGFYCRLCDQNGNAIPGLTYSVNGDSGSFGISTRVMPDAYREWPYVEARVRSMEGNLDVWPEMRKSWVHSAQASRFVLMAQGGRPPYKWTLINGKLPDGLRINRDGSVTGEVSIKSKPGTYKFIAQVMDAVGRRSSRELSIGVKERPNRWYEEGRLVALIHGPEQISGDAVTELAHLMKRQGYLIGMPISYGNGDFVFRWPSIFEPNNELGDVIGQYKKALESEGMKFGMYIGNVEGCPQFSYSQLILVIEDAIKKYHPAAFWLDWLGVDRNSTDALYSMIKSYDPNTLIVLNGIQLPSKGDWDVICIEDMSYGDYSQIWSKWPGVYGRVEYGQTYEWFKTHKFETWKLMMQPRKPEDQPNGFLKNEGVPDWREFLRLQISIIGEGYVANIDHSPAPGMKGNLPNLMDSIPMQCHKQMGDWANPLGLEPLYRSYTQVNPAPLQKASWGYSTINLARDTVYLHILKNPVGKTGMPSGRWLSIAEGDTEARLNIWTDSSRPTHERTSQLLGNVRRLMPVVLNVRSVTWMNAGRKLPFRLSANKLEVDISGVTADPVDTIIKIVLHKPVPETPTAQLRQMPRPKAKPGNLAYMKPAKLLSLDCNRELKPSCEVLYASKAVDGYPDTCAQAAWEYPWTLHVDMLAEQAIGRLVVTFAKAAYATEYKIALSLDGAEWTTVAHVTGCTGGTQTHTFDPMRVRYIRVFGIKPDGPNQPGAQMAISELEVYAR